MAPKKDTTPPAATDPEANKAAAAANAEATAKSEWDELPEPVAMPNKQSTGDIKVNVLETVPEPIRVRAEASLAINVKRVAAKASSTAKRARIDYHWDVQPIKDAEQGARFGKLITKYAKYRPSDKDIPHMADGAPKGQVTARTGDPGYFVKGADGVPVAAAQGDEGAFYGMRYSVRPFEQRGDSARLPGTA